MVEPKRSAPSPESPPSSANKKKNASSSSSAPVVLLLLLLVLASSPSANEAFSSSSYSSYSCPASSSRRRRRPSRRPHDGGFASLSSPPPVHHHPRLPLASSLVEPPPPLRAGGESSSSSSACVVDDDDDDDGAAVRLPSTTTTTPPPGRRKSRQHRRRLSADSVINTSILLSVILVVLEQVLSVDVGITRGWSAIETANRVPLDNWRAYSHVLHSSPVATKAITSGAVYAIGDVLSQRSSSSLPGAGDDFMGDLDRGRVLRSLVAGFVGHGPMSHVWYHVSEAFFDDVIKMQHVWYDFVPKVILDQAIFGPIWNNSYILLLGVMQLHRPGRIWDDMKRTTLPLILKGLKLWPFVHVITYGLIPVENRLLWVDAVEIVWVTILASTASSSPPPPGEEEEEEEKEDKI